jgi:hypothetical protein
MRAMIPTPPEEHLMSRGDDRQIRLNLGPERYRQFRVIAAEECKPMAEIARNVVTRFIDQRRVSRPSQDREPRGGGK